MSVTRDGPTPVAIDPQWLVGDIIIAFHKIYIHLLLIAMVMDAYYYE